MHRTRRIRRPFPVERSLFQHARRVGTGLAVWLAVYSSLAATCAGQETTVADDAQRQRNLDFFESKIRPVLISQCYECHSSAEGEAKGGLTLDTAEGWRLGGDSGPAIMPGEPDESPLIEAIRYEGLEMPPDGRLDAAVIADFETWIERGATDPRQSDSNLSSPADGHSAIDRTRLWSLTPPQWSEQPQVNSTAWPATVVDTYVLAELESAGLQPAADADRATLIRRLSFDLTGLPPTPEQINHFITDTRPNAYERLVDSLLHSPQFGEQWGRHWLDVARYADSNGSDFNATFHEAWRYRNYVIDSFNQDRSYQQFVREQIAGDLIETESRERRTEQLIATGFLMLGPKMLSERNKEKLRMDVIDEQLDTVGRAFLGLTLGCARCHDHKFDPISTEDYYALAGYFYNTQTLEGEIQKYVSNWVSDKLPVSAERELEITRYEQSKSDLEKQLAATKKLIQTTEERLNALKLASLGFCVDDADAEKTGAWKDSTTVPKFVGEGYVHDDKQGKGEKSVAFRIRLPHSGKYDVRVSYTAGNSRDAKVPYRIEHAAGNDTVLVDQRPSPPIDGLFCSLGQFDFRVDQDAVVTVSNRDTTGHVIVDAVQFVPLDGDGQVIEDQDTRPGSELADLDTQLQSDRQRHKALQEQLDRLNASAPQPWPRAMRVRERPTTEECAVRVRGESSNHGPIVPRRIPRSMEFMESDWAPESQSGRAELAQWLSSPRNPLTARVMVNRIWSKLLGRGLVRTADNWGNLGNRPTHPELLDRLAIEFVERNWSTKWLVRQIVLSRTYRLTSVAPEELVRSDPENKLLGRFTRRRIPAESIRDSLLMISGQLDRRRGKSPVAGFATLVVQNDAQSKKQETKTSTRRTVYTPILRSELPPLLTVLDFADPDVVTGTRPTTNVPAQVLLLMNSPFVREAAAQTANRVLGSALNSDVDRITQLFKRVYGRAPTESERSQSLRFLASRTPDDVTAASVPDVRDAWTDLIVAMFSATPFRLLD